MLFELQEVIYESYLQHAQIEITGSCNMRCKHCRAVNEKSKHLTMKEISKVLDFIERNKENDFRITISGGEPFIHPKLVDIITEIKLRGIEDIIITSNASLITHDKLKQLDELKINNLCIQLSLDSVTPSLHDDFRQYKGAYKGVMRVIKMLKSYEHIKSSIRMTVTQNTFLEVDQMIDLVYKLQIERVGIGAVIPVGAGESGELTLNSKEKKAFLELMAKKKLQYMGKLDVTSEDPLKFAIENSPWEYCEGNDIIDEAFFGGCTAGLTGFNVNSEGIITPCAVLFEPVLDIHDYQSVEDMTTAYENSTVIKKLASRKYSGKCGKCEFNRICGGCRATARGFTGDYMGSDGTCWKE
jgi:AdoMet-dependent heme synthase